MAYAHIPSQKRKKLDAKATPSIRVGYSLESEAYRLYDPQQNIVYLSRDIQFVENKKGSTLLEKKKEDAVKEKYLFCFPEQESTAQTRKDSEKADLEERNEIDINYLPEIELGEENASLVQRNQRVGRAPEAKKDYVTYSAMEEADDDPLTVEDALSRPDKDKWFQAM
ncbi:hypothetical protein JTB14_010627 [Gonioctena quinquepunctata]|nr:hypothetical protein JTB14_010627 [Gonioctena quinquepunctata]